MTTAEKHRADLYARIAALVEMAHACGGLPSAWRGHYAALVHELRGYQTDIVANRAIAVSRLYANPSGTCGRADDWCGP